MRYAKYRNFQVTEEYNCPSVHAAMESFREDYLHLVTFLDKSLYLYWEEWPTIKKETNFCCMAAKYTLRGVVVASRVSRGKAQKEINIDEDITTGLQWSKYVNK